MVGLTLKWVIDCRAPLISHLEALGHAQISLLKNTYEKRKYNARQILFYIKTNK